MISKISGKLVEKGNNYLVLGIGDICYDVFLPAAVMQRVEDNIGPDGKLSLITFHYHQVDQNKSIPVLIGFLNEVEKDFFEVFITVSGIGPRAALKALNQPISQIAKAIDEADVKFLKSLPGIGEQRAKEIIAKLQNKVGRFGLIKDANAGSKDSKAKDISEEALLVLMQLEYKKHEAQSMLKKVLEDYPDLQTTEDLLNMVYKQNKSK
ncbi:MAG: hypothetical protein KJ880_03505 [Candidatus Omnitrophica bacterium]|nr:hypothetical protein [Candidatus Omnitrophota bacterium]MBU1870038.1 hypothetical protein [Candidatus Omnitrophota bacterium]